MILIMELIVLILADERVAYSVILFLFVSFILFLHENLNWKYIQTIFTIDILKCDFNLCFQEKYLTCEEYIKQIWRRLHCKHEIGISYLW